MSSSAPALQRITAFTKIKRKAASDADAAAACLELWCAYANACNLGMEGQLAQSAQRHRWQIAQLLQGLHRSPAWAAACTDDEQQSDVMQVFLTPAGRSSVTCQGRTDCRS